MLLFSNAQAEALKRKKVLVTTEKHLHRNKEERNDCKICAQRALGGREVFELKGAGGTSIFDVERAKQIASDGRLPQLTPPDALVLLLLSIHYEETHLPHVNPDISGILGQRFSGAVLLDGVHRAVRCLREKRDFYAYLLTQEETLSCLVVQDLWESNIGMVVRELRQLLQDHPDAAYLEVNLSSSPQALEQIRKLLTPEENARIKISAADSSEKI